MTQHRRSTISIADALTAAAQLGGEYSVEDVESLLEVLGLAVPSPGTNTSASARSGVDPVLTPPRSPDRSLTEISEDPREQAKRIGKVRRGRPVGIIERLPSIPPASLGVSSSAPLSGSIVPLKPIPYVPPVPRRLLRNAVYALIARRRQSSRLDLQKVVEWIASCKSVKDMPAEAELSVADGGFRSC